MIIFLDIDMESDHQFTNFCATGHKKDQYFLHLYFRNFLTLGDFVLKSRCKNETKGCSEKDIPS